MIFKYYIDVTKFNLCFSIIANGLAKFRGRLKEYSFQTARKQAA